MPRKKRLDKDAEQVAIYLTPTEKLVMDVIAARRKRREEERTSPSEIVADALWKILAETEGVGREKIQQLVEVQIDIKQPLDKIKKFPHST
ncbi:MAG TPA: hypothetical protein VH596_03430 [Terriglobales bacterium]